MNRVENETINPLKFNEISSQLQHHVDMEEVGAIIACIEKDGEIVYQNKFGYQNIEKQISIEYNAIFRFYSMTKPIVSIAALQLWEQGKFQLSDPVSKFIPKFKNLKVFNHKTDDGIAVDDLRREITFLDIFTHTSGLSYGWDPEDPVDQGYIKLWFGIYEKSLKNMIDEFLDLPLRYQPGTKWNYSISTDVLGYLVEIISGKNLDTYLNDHILRPLGMIDTGFYVPEEKKSRFVSVYTSSKGKLVELKTPETNRYLSPVSYLSGGGGLVSTLYDYLNFCRMLIQGGELNSKRIIKSETIELMRKNHLSDEIPQLEVMGNSKPFEGIRFGLGVAVKVTGGTTNFPIGSYFWAGAALTNFVIDPSNKLIAIFLSQYMPRIDRVNVFESFLKSMSIIEN